MYDKVLPVLDVHPATRDPTHKLHAAKGQACRQSLLLANLKCSSTTRTCGQWEIARTSTWFTDEVHDIKPTAVHTPGLLTQYTGLCGGV
jgi:hypothetical protein